METNSETKRPRIEPKPSLVNSFQLLVRIEIGNETGNEPAIRLPAVISYREPENWTRYVIESVLPHLVEARVAIDTLRAMPFQRSWVLETLLDIGRSRVDELRARMQVEPYSQLKNPEKALRRDIDHLLYLGAIRAEPPSDPVTLEVRPEWPEEITDIVFLEKFGSSRPARSSNPQR